MNAGSMAAGASSSGEVVVGSLWARRRNPVSGKETNLQIWQHVFELQASAENSLQYKKHLYTQAPFCSGDPGNKNV